MGFPATRDASTTVDVAPWVIDCHSDLVLELALRHAEPNPAATHWIPKLAAGGVRLQVCALFTDTENLDERALRRALNLAAAAIRAVRENPDRLRLVREEDDLRAVERGAQIGLMLALEGAEPLGYDPGLADVFVELGVRMVSLTWQRRNAFADGAAEAPSGGLSRLGLRLVDRLVELGVILDLAHANERTFYELLDRAPEESVIVSHAGCRAIFDTPRNLDDRQLATLAARGGVLGIMAAPAVVHASDWTLGRLVDHIEHAESIMGIDGVGLGGDFSDQIIATGAWTPNFAEAAIPMGSAPPPNMLPGVELAGLAGPQDYPNLVRALEERGYAGERLAAILHGNVLRLFREALGASPQRR